MHFHRFRQHTRSIYVHDINAIKKRFCRSFEGIVVQFVLLRSWLFWRNIYHLWNALRAHSSVWLAILFTLCVCNLLISDRSMPQNQYIIFPQFCYVFICVDLLKKFVHFFRKNYYFFFFNLLRKPVPLFFFLCFLKTFLLDYFWCRNVHFLPSRNNKKIARWKKTGKINGNKFKINAQCVNKNLGWNKILHLAWIRLSIHWNSLGYSLCMYGCAAEAHSKGDFGVVQVIIIILLLHACRWMWVI